jgi:hypothetical protein
MYNLCTSIYNLCTLYLSFKLNVIKINILNLHTVKTRFYIMAGDDFPLEESETLQPS